MATQKLTLNLPEEIFHHLARIAELTHQTIESLTVQSIKSNLPPSVENAPLEMQGRLQAMQTLSVDELFKIAQSQVPAVQQQHHLALLERNQETESMSPGERQELRKLGEAADQLMLKKAYAWAILRWRGYRIPALDELPLD